jgi:hypothetical protein
MARALSLRGPVLRARHGATQQDTIVSLGDPARGNRYAYAGDDPVNFIDPSGLKFLGISKTAFENRILAPATGFAVAFLVASGSEALTAGGGTPGCVALGAIAGEATSQYIQDTNNEAYRARGEG